MSLFILFLCNYLMPSIHPHSNFNISNFEQVFHYSLLSNKYKCKAFSLDMKSRYVKLSLDKYLKLKLEFYKQKLIDRTFFYIQSPFLKGN